MRIRRICRFQGFLLERRSKALVPGWFWSGNAATLLSPGRVDAGRLVTSSCRLPKDFHSRNIATATTMSINGIDKNRSDSEVNGVLDCSTEEQKCRLDWIIKNDISAVVNDILTFHEAIGNRGVRLRERWERNLQLERHCSGCCSLKDEGSVAISSESLELAKYHALWNNAAHRDADSSLEENFHIDVGKAIDLTRIIQGSNNMQNGAPGSQSNGSTSSAPSTQPLCSGAIKGQSGSDSDVYSGIPLLESISGKSNSMDALFEHADTNLLLDFDALKNGSKQPNEFTIPLDVQEVVDDIAGRATPPLSVDSLLVRELPEVDCYNGGKYDSFAPKKENIGLNSEQARNDGLTQGLTLLRTLSEEDWTAFDHPVDYEWQAAEGRAAASDDHVLTDVEITRSNAEHIKVTSDNADSFKSDEKGYEGTIGMLLDLCEAAKLEGEHLTTADYNFILVRMALATELVPDEILALMMQTYRQMADLARAGFRECRPNERSNEILLLALSRRLAAFQTAIDVMISLTNSDCFVWTPRTLEVTMQLCERKSYHGLARKLLNDLQSDTASEIDIPWGVYHSLINVLKIDDARRSVIEVLQLALKRGSRTQDKSLDSVFVNAIKWPIENRHSKAIDNSPVISEILGMLESEKLFVPGFPVWKQLIVTSAMGARDNELRWNFVARAFRCLSSSEPSFWPDHVLLKHGLEASNVLFNAELASDLIRRAVENYRAPRVSRLFKTAIDKSSLHTGSGLQVPLNDIAKAMNICLRAGNMVACGKILSCVDKPELGARNMSFLYLLSLKGYANAGDSSSAEKIIMNMQEKNIQPGEEAYGSLIYAYALSNQLDCARTLLLSMESGELGVRPGPKCYDGFILACIRSRAWEDAISTYKKMDESGLIPSPAACHGIVLAAFRTGGRSEVKAHLERFSASGAQLHGDGALLAVKTMLPTMADIGVTMSSIRDHLRGVGEKESSLQFERLNLVRSLRVAELETQRQPSPNLKIDVLQKRRRVAWQNALKDLITYANAVEAEEQASHS